eukprot:325405_1
MYRSSASYNRRPTTNRQGRSSLRSNHTITEMKRESHFRSNPNISLSGHNTSCTKCNCRLSSHNANTLIWSHCSHPYCIPCASDLVNECLSLLNCIPKCCAPECNAILTISDAKTIQLSILSKYQTYQINNYPTT